MHAMKCFIYFVNSALKIPEYLLTDCYGLVYPYGSFVKDFRYKYRFTCMRCLQSVIGENTKPTH